MKLFFEIYRTGTVPRSLVFKGCPKSHASKLISVQSGGPMGHPWAAHGWPNGSQFPCPCRGREETNRKVDKSAGRGIRGLPMAARGKPRKTRGTPGATWGKPRDIWRPWETLQVKPVFYLSWTSSGLCIIHNFETEYTVPVSDSGWPSPPIR